MTMLGAFHSRHLAWLDVSIISHFSCQHYLEINRNFISPEAAELDKIQCQYDIVFVVAGTNKPSDISGEMMIGAPADSLNSIVVNAVNSKGEAASYHRVGPVLSFFNKPDISYYGGDYDQKIRVCTPFGEGLVSGTSFAAPWISRKMAYLIHIMGFTREVAKALLIDSAAAWNRRDDVSHSIGYGVVPRRIESIVQCPNDEIRFIMTGSTDEYETYTYNIPVPISKDKQPFFARATLCYFPRCSRHQGVDYTSTEMDIHFGRIKEEDGKAKIVSINANKQSDEGFHLIREEHARKMYRKWDNVKLISDIVKNGSRPRKVYGPGMWGLSIITKERLRFQNGRGLQFGVVVTLKEMHGENRIDDFIKLCMMRGWIVSRGNSKYAVVYYEGKGGSRRQVWKSGLTMNEALRLKENKNLEAQRRKAEERSEKLGTSLPSKVSLEEFMHRFIEQYGAKHWGASYYAHNVSLLNNYIVPHLGHHRIVDVTTKMIDDYYDFLLTECEPVFNSGTPRREHLSAAQIRSIDKFLKSAFKQAKRWKMVVENPIQDANAPSHKATERPALSPYELERILLYTDRPDDYEKYIIHVALCIQYYCTTRGGEVSALQWSDFDSEAKTLHIYKTISRIKREYLTLPKLKIYYTFPDITINTTAAIVLKSPKTKASEHISKINDLLIAKLERLKSMQREMLTSVFCSHYYDNQLIICQPNGRPLMPEQLNRKFKSIILEMCSTGFKFSSVPADRINEVVFHSVRAASATKKLAVSGGNISAVMAAGGWAEPDMVIRYSKTYDEDQEHIAQQMEDDYLKKPYTNNTLGQNELRRYLTEHPEIINEILQVILKEKAFLQSQH